MLNNQIDKFDWSGFENLEYLQFYIFDTPRDSNGEKDYSLRDSKVPRVTREIRLVLLRNYAIAKIELKTSAINNIFGLEGVECL